MPSPKKITATDILNNRNSSLSNLQANKKQIHTMSSTTNNGFLRGNSTPLLNAYENSNERRQSLDNRSNGNNAENSPLLDVRSDPPIQTLREDQNTSGSALLGISYKNTTDSLPVEIVVLDNRVLNKEESSGILEKDESYHGRELSNMQDVRICENPLTNVSVNSEPEPKVFSNVSKSKTTSSPSENLKMRSWFRNSTKLEKYLACTIVVLILSLSIIFLAFLTKTDCLGLERKVCLTEECVRTASSLLAAMDLTANPCHDFFQFACGTWNKKHVIPEDKSSVSTFEVLADQIQVILKDVLEEPFEEHENSNSATRKAKLFYKSCMNVQQIRKIGDAPLKDVLRKLGGWPVAIGNWTPPSFSVETLLGKIRGDYNEGVLVEQWVGPDDKNSSVNILQLDQMQLALPSRDYYLKSSSDDELKAYHKYMTQVAVLLGANSSTAGQELEEVVKFEIQLANATLPEADRHDTSVIYKKLPLKILQKEVPELNWKEYLSSFIDTKIQEEEPVVTYALPYLMQMGKILKRTDRRVIHNYVVWRLIMKIIPHMIDEYQQKTTEFRKILQGILSERHRWSQCVEWTNKKLGMAVGALFIRDNFNQDSKVVGSGNDSNVDAFQSLASLDLLITSETIKPVRLTIPLRFNHLYTCPEYKKNLKGFETALEMIHTIREAFNELLTENIWMDDETRAVAKEKADSMNERIGYPELLTDVEELNKEYMNLTLTDDQFLVNVLSVLKYDAYHNLQKLRQPVNKDKWSTEPAVVNAFYNPNKNDIVFPAGILQPLFYSQHFPKSLNYGGIGVVIGHEITHGFDDKGRQFDKDGNMMQWWNNATIKAFRERTQCIIDQYSRYKLAEIDLFVNGRMTQGENIADNGGLKQSFRAYKKWVAKHGEEPLLPGINLTHDQLFFLNYAQIWCGSMRPEEALTKIRSSVHSPGPVRVLGPLSNSWDFAQAYNCPPKSPMNPTSKCSVW